MGFIIFIMTYYTFTFYHGTTYETENTSERGGPGISLNPTCTQGDSLLLSVSTIVSEECPLTKECPPPTVHAQLHNCHLAITECVFVSSHFEVPSLMIQISMALTLKYSLSWLHLSQCLRDLGINPNIPNTSDIATLNLINGHPTQPHTSVLRGISV